MDFIRVNTRLYCDIYEAFRMLSKEARLEKYFGKSDSTLILKNESFLLECIEKDEYVKVEWHFKSPRVSFIFNIMNCTSKTEYCTEVHLLIKSFNPEYLEQNQESFRLIGNSVLEVLRKHYNKDWVIKDSDLHLSQFRGSF